MISDLSDWLGERVRRGNDWSLAVAVEEGLVEVLEAIKSRRSVRCYHREPVCHDLVDTILEAGIWAPSTKNLQPWRFVVVQGPLKDHLAEILGQVAEQMILDPDPQERARGFSARWSAQITREAPVLITVWNSAPVSKGADALLRDPNPGRLLAWTVEIQSLAAAIQNMLLAAHSLGLAGLWNCDLVHAALQVKECLQQFQRVGGDLIAGVVIGHPRLIPHPPHRYCLAEVVSWMGSSGEQEK